MPPVSYPKSLNIPASNLKGRPFKGPESAAPELPEALPELGFQGSGGGRSEARLKTKKPPPSRDKNTQLRTAFFSFRSGGFGVLMKAPVGRFPYQKGLLASLKFGSSLPAGAHPRS